MGTLTAPQTDAWKNQGRETTGEFGTKLYGDPEIAPLAPVETVFTKKYESKDEQQTAFHAELAARVASLDTDENWHNYLNTMSSFHRYSMSNQMLIAIQCPEATLVAGFKKWGELGRNVAGAKGIRIFGFSTWTKDEKDASGKPKLDKNGKQITSSGRYFPVVCVYDVSQTHGRPLPEAYEQMTEEPPAGFIEDLEQSIRDAGFTVTYETIPGAGHGFTQPDTKRVVVDETLSPAGRARTLAHERGHIALGHLDRMDEYHTGHDGGARGSMEVEAESFAYVVCRANGMSTMMGGQSSTYVAGWAGTDKDALEKSAAAIAAATKTVLGEDLFVARDRARDLERAELVAEETAIAVADWEVEHAAERVILEAGWAAEKLAKAAARAEKAAAKAAAK